MGEIKLKTKFANAFGGWFERYEPARGSGVGYPDLQFLMPFGLLPIEVKEGWIDFDRLMTKEVRPSQIRWHHSFVVCGGVALVVVIVTGKDKKWTAYALKDCKRATLSSWKKGWSLHQTWLVAAEGMSPEDIMQRLCLAANGMKPSSDCVK